MIMTKTRRMIVNPGLSLIQSKTFFISPQYGISFVCEDTMPTCTAIEQPPKKQMMNSTIVMSG
jgi:hypothetical protein